MENEMNKGSRWEGIVSLVLAVAAVFLGLPAVGSHEFLDLVPFVLAVAVGTGLTIHGVRKGQHWNRVVCGVSILLLAALSVLMAVAVRMQETP